MNSDEIALLRSSQLLAMTGVRPVGATLAVALLCGSVVVRSAVVRRGRDGARPVCTIIGRVATVDDSPKFGGKVE
jgi:hypothetical protein